MYAPTTVSRRRFSHRRGFGSLIGGKGGVELVLNCRDCLELTALGGFDSDAAANLSPTDETPMLVYPENKIISIFNQMNSI